MANPQIQPVLIKLNRFLFFSESSSSSSPSPSPSSPTDFLNTILLQLKEWLTAIPNLILSLLHKLDDAFPPETRSRWLQIAAVCAAVIAAAVALCFCVPLVLNLLIWVVVTCCNIVVAVFMGLWVTCCWVVRGLWLTCCLVVGGVLAACCWVGMGLWVTCKGVCFSCVPASVEMMRAPGAAGLMIARGMFEAAPQAYFAALRAGELVVRGVTVVAFPGA